MNAPRHDKSLETSNDISNRKQYDKEVFKFDMFLWPAFQLHVNQDQITHCPEKVSYYEPQDWEKLIQIKEK